MATHTGEVAQKTITLTNWKRLVNTTIQFNVERAQALTWNDYVVVIASDSRNILHLYHLKHGLWSQITVKSQNVNVEEVMCNCDVQEVNPPVYYVVNSLTFAVYEGNLIFLSTDSGSMSKFSANRWVECPELKLNLINPQRPAILASEASLFNHTSDSLIVLESRDGSSLHTFRYLQNSQWSQPSKLQKSICVSDRRVGIYHISFVTVRGYMYISNGIRTYCIDTSKAAESIPVSEITRLPLHLFTISIVEDTLLAFGGKDEDNQPSSDVYRYNPHSKVWKPAGYMRNARYGVIVAPVPQDENTDVIVIGGYLGERSIKDRILSCITELCEVSISQ